MRRPIGFSTGSLNPVSPLEAIAESLALGADAVELSALRLHELDAIANASRDPLLERFRWVSVHAPSKFETAEEQALAKEMLKISQGRFPVVVHPDQISDFGAWRNLEGLLVLENMDRRKQTGRFSSNFVTFFEELPSAKFCLDLAHVRQVDPSLVEAYRFLRSFQDRLVELHISEVGSFSRHAPLSLHANSHLRDFARLIPESTPAIIESVLDETTALDELESVRRFFARTGDRYPAWDH